MKVIDKSVMKLHRGYQLHCCADARLCTFEKCVSDSKCNSVKKLRLDCPTRWNSTYLMLKRALVAKDALVLYVIVDTPLTLACVMLEKFEKYWGDYSTLLAIAVVLDPRYKMLYVPNEVEACVKEIYNALVEMYKFYDTSPTSSSAQSSHDLILLVCRSGMLNQMWMPT
ncbi:Zinc finger BED domain-containing protein RICESLEEPER 4 [Bienertia sinuspersici]